MRVQFSDGILDATVSQLLQSRFDCVGDGLVSRFEITLALIGGLNTRVCKRLCAAATGATATRVSGGSLF